MTMFLELIMLKISSFLTGTESSLSIATEDAIKVTKINQLLSMVKSFTLEVMKMLFKL
jgi:hypothetical protein